MPPSAYPTPSAGGPPYLKLLQLANEYRSVVVKEMVDGGATYGADTTNAVMKWQFDYDGLTASQAATLDAHFASAYGSLLGFNFTDPRTSTLYTDVHYDPSNGFVADHAKTFSQSRKVILVKRPA